MPRDKVAYDEADNNPQAYKTYGGSVKARYDFGAIDFTSITAYEPPPATAAATPTAAPR